MTVFVEQPLALLRPAKYWENESERWRSGVTVYGTWPCQEGTAFQTGHLWRYSSWMVIQLRRVTSRHYNKQTPSSWICLAEKYRIYLTHFCFRNYNVFNEPLPFPVKEIGFLCHILPLTPFRSLAKPKNCQRQLTGNAGNQWLDLCVDSLEEGRCLWLW